MNDDTPVSSLTRGPGSRLRRLIGLAPDSARALALLIRARLEHLGLKTTEVLALNDRAIAKGRPFHACTEADLEDIGRISYVMPRVASLLPWRSDCLIQAMAAQRWLLSKGIASTIVIGVDRSDKIDFAAHAWLRCGDRIVTGGEVSNFKVLLETASEPQ